MTLIQKVKLSLRVSTSSFDSELEDLIAAAEADLRLVGISKSITESPEDYPLVVRAIETYCKIHFGEPANPELLMRSYDLQKAQLMMSREYAEDNITLRRCR